MTSPRTTLHEAIILVLRGVGGGPRSCDWIANEINSRGLYTRKKDDQPLPSFQVRLRAISKGYRHFFVVDNDMISLAKSS
jgi:hypothetical protein